jgi:hypothetical protein
MLNDFALTVNCSPIVLLWGTTVEVATRSDAGQHLCEISGGH